jgi:2-haloacid dehalogenase
MLDAVVAHCGIGGYLRAVISVDAARTFKPSPAVYALGPARLGLPASSLLFVSSNGWDVAGAQACGFPVAWVNRLRSPGEELGIAPDVEVPDLAALARALAPARRPGTGGR